MRNYSVYFKSLLSLGLMGSTSFAQQSLSLAPNTPPTAPLAAQYALSNEELTLRLQELDELVRRQQATIDDQQIALGALEAAPAAVPSHIDLGDAVGEPLEAKAFPKYTIGGQYRLMYNSANFDFHQPQLSDAQDSGTFFNQHMVDR